jgi:hypothetical protein
MQGAQQKNPRQKTSIKKASSIKLTLKGEGDTFHFKSQSRTKATHQNKNQRTASSPKPTTPT